MVERGPQNGIVVDEARIVEVVTRALEAHRNRLGFLQNEGDPPEKVFIELVKGYGQEHGLDTFALHALFFVTPTFFGDSTARQLNTLSDSTRLRRSAWVFKPEEIVTKRKSSVVRAARRITKPGGYNSTAINEWQHNARVIHENFGGDLRNFFAAHGNDAPEILKALIGPRKGKAKHPGFRRFGPKIARLFLLWVDQYKLADLQDIREVGVPVDFQVARVTIQTKGIELAGPTHNHQVLDETLVPLYAKLCKENGWHPQEVSAALWTIGSVGCGYRLHSSCPLEALCTSLISSRRVNDDGRFDPTDIGRYDPPEKVRERQLAEARRRRHKKAGQLELNISP